MVKFILSRRYPLSEPGRLSLDSVVNTLHVKWQYSRISILLLASKVLDVRYRRSNSGCFMAVNGYHRTVMKDSRHQI